MNEIQIYNNPEFGEIRTLTIDGEPWFVGKDVAEALGYEAPKNAIPSHVDEDDRVLVNAETQHRFSAEFSYKELGQRGGWLINESGLYSLILSSKLPGAKKFKRWVTSEVLPSIRKTGNFFGGSKELRAIFLLDERTVQHEERITALEGTMVIDYGQQRILTGSKSDSKKK